MDLTVILGMVIAVASIATGDIMEGGNPAHVLHITSIIIVIPTAMASAMTGTAPEYVKAAFKEIKIVFKKSPIDLHERIKQIVEFAIIARRDGILALESHANNMDDEFFKKGLSMAVDGTEAHDIEETLEIMIEETEEYYHGAAHYWLLAGETCPVMGLIGAVLGLILALQKLDNPAEMAAGIAGVQQSAVWVARGMGFLRDRRERYRPHLGRNQVQGGDAGSVRGERRHPRQARRRVEPGRWNVEAPHIQLPWDGRGWRGRRAGAVIRWYPRHVRRWHRPRLVP